MNIDFSKMNAMWGQVDKSKAEKVEEKVEFEEVPDGNYIVYVEKVHWRTSRAGNAYLSWQLRIMAGEHEGRCIFKKSMCTTPQNMRTFQTAEARRLSTTLRSWTLVTSPSELLRYASTPKRATLEAL